MCRYKSEGDTNGLSDCDSLRRENEMNHDLIRKLREEIRVLREERRWISVGERLPDDETWMDVAGPWGEIIGYYDGDQWLDTQSESLDEVTHFRERTPGPEVPNG